MKKLRFKIAVGLWRVGQIAPVRPVLADVLVARGFAEPFCDEPDDGAVKDRRRGRRAPKKQNAMEPTS